MVEGQYLHPAQVCSNKGGGGRGRGRRLFASRTAVLVRKGLGSILAGPYLTCSPRSHPAFASYPSSTPPQVPCCGAPLLHDAVRR